MASKGWTNRQAGGVGLIFSLRLVIILLLCRSQVVSLVGSGLSLTYHRQPGVMSGLHKMKIMAWKLGNVSRNRMTPPSICNWTDTLWFICDVQKKRNKKQKRLGLCAVIVAYELFFFFFLLGTSSSDEQLCLFWRHLQHCEAEAKAETD